MARKTLLKRAVSSFTALAISTVAMPIIATMIGVSTTNYACVFWFN